MFSLPRFRQSPAAIHKLIGTCSLLIFSKLMSFSSTTKANNNESGLRDMVETGVEAVEFDLPVERRQSGHDPVVVEITAGARLQITRNQKMDAAAQATEPS